MAKDGKVTPKASKFKVKEAPVKAAKGFAAKAPKAGGFKAFTKGKTKM